MNVILTLSHSSTFSSLTMHQKFLRGGAFTTAKTQAIASSGHFEPAISLEDFKNVDPERFEWVNPDEVKAGETTCGFLKAPLGWEVEELDIVYPMVKICKFNIMCFLSKHSDNMFSSRMNMFTSRLMYCYFAMFLL